VLRFYVVGALVVAGALVTLAAVIGSAGWWVSLGLIVLQRDVNEIGYEYPVHSTKPLVPPEDVPRVTVGGPDCTQPYNMALLNVSAMSFGALSSDARF